MPEKEIDGASKVVVNTPVSAKTLEGASKTMLVDENGVDIEDMQNMIKKQAQMIQDMSTIIKSRDAEDAEITRQLILSKSKKWVKPFTYDEITDFEKDELDDLHRFVCRVGRVNLSDADESPRTTMTKAAKRFPKMSKDSEPYDMNSHSFSVGSK